MESHEARYAEVVIIYEGINISKDIAPYLLSFTYTDNASDKADDISFSLEDREMLWLDDWFPAKGDKVKASIVVHDWDAADKTESLPCGTFEVDPIDCSGPPNQVTIKAISTLVSKPMRQEKHTKAWENVRLSTIAGDMANKNGLKLFWDCPDDPLFERRDQVQISDLEFLSVLCLNYGIAVKVTDNQLVCYDEEKYEEKESVDSLSLNDKKIIKWNFSTKARGTYKAAHLKYHDAVKNQTFEATETGYVEGTGRTLELNIKADSIADAEKIAKKKLFESNKKEISGSITLMGDLRFVGGSNIELSEFGVFDGKYAIEKATHTVNSGYTTKLDLRMGEKNKKERKKKKNKKKGTAQEIFYTGTKYYGYKE